jgi:xanthine dehydrogenase accessory factor
MDRASEFLAMAAHLLEIKSRRLLPSATQEEIEEVEQEEEALIRQLEQIKLYRDACEALAQMGEEGFRRERLERIHTPIGLDINAMTLEEIAVSIVAELVQERRAGTPRRSKSVELTQTDPDQEVLEFVKDPEPKALVVVVETMGSTPVKTGALLAVDRNLRSAGTIGGGCAESACIRQARQLIGTGEQKLFPVSLNEPDAEEQGMACGGSMQVLAIDLG